MHTDSSMNLNNGMHVFTHHGSTHRHCLHVRDLFYRTGPMAPGVTLPTYIVGIIAAVGVVLVMLQYDGARCLTRWSAVCCNNIIGRVFAATHSQHGIGCIVDSVER
jgi:hypothetical protein